MEAKNWLKELAGAQMNELPAALRNMMADSSQVQKEVLGDILSYAAGCEYGKKYGFADISSIEEFRKKVPVTEFSDYLDDIERMKKGEENILFPGKASFFAVSSATTGNAKYIPDSPAGEKIKSMVVNLRTVEIVRSFPQVLKPGNKLFTIVNSGVYGYSEGGIPCGAASGQAASASTVQLLSVPAALLKAQGITPEILDYMTVLFNLAQSNVVMLVCNNMAHFHLLSKLMNDRAKDFIHDIREGSFSVDVGDKELLAELQKSWQPNPERAAELEEIYKEKGGFLVGDIWKNFKYVGCWMSAGVGRAAKEFRYLFPETTVFWDWGYGASEGKLNIPYEAGNSFGYPAIFGYFMEFKPMEGGEPLLLEETKDGCDYELILTTYSGFYRYNIHDIVRISHSKEGLITICFVGKTADSITIDKRTLYSSTLTAFIEEYEAEHNLMLRVFQGHREGNGLKLEVEPVESSFDVEDFEAYIKEKLAGVGISLAGVTRHPEGYRDSLFVKKIQGGTSVNQAKLLVFTK